MIENSYYAVQFNLNTCSIQSILNKKLNKTYLFQQNFIHYESAEGSAYVFRPSFTYNITNKCKITFTKGEIVQQVYQGKKKYLKKKNKIN